MLKKIYDDNFTSFARFWGAVKKDSSHTSRKTAKAFYDRQQATQVFKPKSKANNPIVCPYGIGCLQIDLLDSSRFASQNAGINFYLVVVDVTSRYAWMRPLKNKTSVAVLAQFKKVLADFRKHHRKNKVTVTSDDGTEFQGAFSQFLKSKGIDHYASTHKTNTGIVERFNRTVWNYIRKKTVIAGSLAFNSSIPSFVSRYNKDVHSSLGILSPHAIFIDGVIPMRVPQRVLSKEFKVGDLVRVEVKSRVFDKRSFVEKFSKSVYRVVGVEKGRYMLKNVDSGLELKKRYLAREMIEAGSKSDDTKGSASSEKAVTKLNERNATKRRLTREPAFKLDEGERRRLQPKKLKRTRNTPLRFRGAGLYTLRDSDE